MSIDSLSEKKQQKTETEKLKTQTKQKRNTRCDQYGFEANEEVVETSSEHSCKILARKKLTKLICATL